MMTNSDLAAIPLFIFMASMLERAGLIEEMFNVVYKWMGGAQRGPGDRDDPRLHYLGSDGWGYRCGCGDHGYYRFASNAQTWL